MWCTVAGLNTSSAAAFLELLPAPAWARLIAPDLLSGDLWRRDASFRLFAEFGRFVFASLLLADISQSFEHVRAVSDLVDGKPFP
jgi:hypothetical protein